MATKESVKTTAARKWHEEREGGMEAIEEIEEVPVSKEQELKREKSINGVVGWV